MKNRRVAADWLHVPLPWEQQLRWRGGIAMVIREGDRPRGQAGEYETPSDLLIHADYLLDEHDRVRQQRLEDLRRVVAIGIEQAERGETKAFTMRTIKRIAVEGRKRLAEEAERLRAEADRVAENAKQPIDETGSAD